MNARAVFIQFSPANFKFPESCGGTYDYYCTTISYGEERDSKATDMLQRKFKDNPIRNLLNI